MQGVLYILTSSDWCNGSKKRVYDTFEEARAVMNREVKSRLKKKEGWEVDYHKWDCARIRMKTHFFDKMIRGKSKRRLTTYQRISRIIFPLWTMSKKSSTFVSNN